jgi:hypothetical protein
MSEHQFTEKREERLRDRGGNGGLVFLWIDEPAQRRKTVHCLVGAQDRVAGPVVDGLKERQDSAVATRDQDLDLHVVKIAG